MCPVAQRRYRLCGVVVFGAEYRAHGAKRVRAIFSTKHHGARPSRLKPPRQAAPTPQRRLGLKPVGCPPCGVWWGIAHVLTPLRYAACARAIPHQTPLLHTANKAAPRLNILSPAPSAARFTLRPASRPHQPTLKHSTSRCAPPAHPDLNPHPVAALFGAPNAVAPPAMLRTRPTPRGNDSSGEFTAVRHGPTHQLSAGSLR